MTYTIERFNITFKLPKRITVRQSLQFWGVFSVAIKHSMTMFLDLWAAIVELGLISEWQCEFFQLDTPLEQVEDQRVAEVVMEVCNIVRTHMERLDTLEKN
jgi:hypothetical protein